MSDIFREVDEELRRDRLDKLWKRWGGVVIAIAVLVVAATAGYTAWRNWRLSTAAAETGQLVSSVRLADPAGEAGADEAAQALAALAEEAGGGRDVLARFYEAAFRAKAGDREAAARLYAGIADADVEPSYRDLARLLSVLHAMPGGDPAELRARLAPLLEPGNPWRHSARELTGVLLAQAGDRAAAAQMFRELSEDVEAPPGVRARAADLAVAYAEAQ